MSPIRRPGRTLLQGLERAARRRANWTEIVRWERPRPSSDQQKTPVARATEETPES